MNYSDLADIQSMCKRLQLLASTGKIMVIFYKKLNIFKKTKSKSQNIYLYIII